MLKNNILLILSFFLTTPLLANENINITNVWINEAPPNVTVLAAYATIENLSNVEQSLVSVTSPSFKKVEIHLSKIVNDMARMEKQNSIIIPIGKSIVLSPGGYHLMLFNPELPIKADNKIKINFNFADSTSYSVDALVIKKNNGGHDHHHNHHDH
jgi:periplasmic copper chaperone A